MKLFSITVKLAATAYIKADSEEEAMEILTDRVGDGSDYKYGEEDVREVIDGSEFNVNMPDFSLSPAMTYYGPFDSEECLDEVEDFADEDETDGEEE